MTGLRITRAGPLTTLQDAGRFGMLKHGISASGAMDRAAYGDAGRLLGEAGNTAIELAQGIGLAAEGLVRLATAGGRFRIAVNGAPAEWNTVLELLDGDTLDIAPGDAGNYGYLRFHREVDVAPVLGSRSTNVAVGLGGYKGRALKAGDRLALGEVGSRHDQAGAPAGAAGPVRVMWGLHSPLFAPHVRDLFATTTFRVSTTLDRMGVRLDDIAGLFHGQHKLNLVSDAIVPGDIQIVGDGVPVVLMRDHQPTGGYPRIATVVSADLDRFAQMRPGTEVMFRPVTLEHAR
jgi:biotin-dependent carboxylase-like uncharacterized protein